jgi:N-acetylmuramoyl-L-alanine amidase
MRPITKLILHCSATPEGRPATVAEVTAWHRQRGFSTIGYHYLIGLNGERWQGRPIKEPGAHCEGHNANSIGVCYVGGLAADGKTPKDTRTVMQKLALSELIKELKACYPAATVHGHREFANKACPSFDVKKEFK